MTNISHIDHIAITVNRIDDVKDFYEQALGLKISHIEEVPERGIRTAFIKMGQSCIELIEPINENSEISASLKKRGPGLHHVAFATTNIKNSSEQALSQGVKLTYDLPQSGAHQTKINFIHPKSSSGVLIELVEK
ncbi:MAG: methylmalonyl-CoA epimerase [Myxococcales bacterium]|nr:methylmalonyl-CoA epimerase [Myxococcales bacterium]USN51856.1 MAG: methylmalonyl-CoA epimerase [Myxococcales bacterium]